MKDGNIRHFFELLEVMTEKELRARYKHTAFGFLWLVINPLLQMLVISFVFRFFVKSPISHYELYLFLNLLIWNFFSVSLSKATPSIVWERSLIKKTYFPRSIIPFSIILANFFHLLTALVLLGIPLSLTGMMAPWGLPLTICSLFMLLGCTTGISLLTSALNVRFRDVNFFVQAILIIWFYATPIVYTLNMIPYGHYWIWRMNPLTSVFQLLQHAYLGKPLPGWGMLGINTAVILVLLTLGFAVFNRESRNFDDFV